MAPVPTTRRAVALAIWAALVAGAAPARGDACSSSTECAERNGYGAVCESAECREYVDRTDLLLKFGLAEKNTERPKPFRLLPTLIPAIGYNPALGFLIGVVGNAGMYLGDPETTTISNASALILLTTNKQLVIQLNGVVMTEGNAWELQSDWRFMIYNQDTFGLGTGTPPVSHGITIGGWGTTAEVAGAQPMDFNLLRLHQLALHRVVGALYAGGGYRLDSYFGIGDKRLDLGAAPPVVTSHYAYSKYYGFSTSSYAVSSVSLDLLYDSRDSTINTYRGIYANLDYRISPTWLGSSQASTLLYGEARAYLGLSTDVPRNVLAFWVIAQGVTTGTMPYLALPSTSWDARSTTGRGFVQGRFRGTAEVYGEVELRFRITEDGFLGGALFANAQTFSRPAVSIPGYQDGGESLFHTIVPAGGAGLRFMMNRESRTNVRLDIGVGEGSVAFYLGAGEVF